MKKYIKDKRVEHFIESIFKINITWLNLFRKYLRYISHFEIKLIIFSRNDYCESKHQKVIWMIFLTMLIYD